MNEGLRLMTPDEHLTKLKAEGYDYFLHDDDIYQYEDGKLLHVFGEGIELWVSEDINDFKVAEFPEDYLSMIGLTHDFVAFMVAKKAEIIILDESNLPIAQYGPDYPNVPSAFLHRHDFKGIANMLVRYESPGYHSEMGTLMDSVKVEKKQRRFHKVFHNGNFFYPGLESHMSRIDYTSSFYYYTGPNHDAGYFDMSDNYEEYTLIQPTDSLEEQLHLVLKKIIELYATMPYKDRFDFVPFRDVQIHKRIQPIHAEDRTKFERVVNFNMINKADGKIASYQDAKTGETVLYQKNQLYTSSVSDQEEQYSIDRLKQVLAEYDIAHQKTEKFDDYAEFQIAIRKSMSPSQFTLIHSTVTWPETVKECPLGLVKEFERRSFRVPGDYPFAFDEPPYKRETIKRPAPESFSYTDMPF